MSPEDKRVKIRDYARAYRARNPEKYLAEAKRSRERRRVENRVFMRTYYIKNRDRIIARNEQYRRTHPTQSRERYNRYRKRREETDPAFKLYGRMRVVVREALNRQNIKKSHRTFAMLGYTPAQLKAHLESLFEPWMNWDNYGKGGWHIDHRKPQCLFVFSSVEDAAFKECWALSNLRPLAEITNLKLGAEAKKQKAALGI